MTTFDPRRIGTHGCVAAMVPVDALPRRGKESTLPPTCAALIGRGRDRLAVVRGGEPLELDVGDNVLLFSPAVQTAVIRVERLLSADDHACAATLELEIQVIAEPAELAALCRAFPSVSSALTVEEISRRVQPSVTAILSAYAAGLSAAELLRGPEHAHAAERLRDRLAPELFAAGLSLSRIASIRFESSTWEALRREQQRAELLARQTQTDLRIAEMAEAARRQRLAGMESLVQRLTALAAERPGVGLSELIRAFGPTERGELYRASLGLSAGDATTRRIVAVAGQEIIGIRPDAPETAEFRTTLPSDAGPLRSVRRLPEGGLLVGAARGVFWTSATGEVLRSFMFEPSAALRGGVNAVARAADRLLATHSEVGLISWPIEGDTEPTYPLRDLLSAATTVRDVQVDDGGQVWLAANDAVIRWTPGDGWTQRRILSARVGALAVDASLVVAGLDDGRVVGWPPTADDSPVARSLRPATGDAVRAINVLRAGGVMYVLIADGRPMVDLCVADDAYHMEYRATEPLRWGWVGPDLIAAVNERRDRIFLWPIGRSDAPSGVAPVSRWCGHTIQDAVLVPSQTAPAA